MVKKRKLDLRDITIKGSEPISDSIYPGNHLKLSRYSLLTFIPKNLFEQFQRVSNIWFLIVSIFQLIPYQLNPTDSWTTIVPLSILLLITLIKDAYCDHWFRKKDKIFNNAIYPCWDGKRFINTKSEALLVGQFIILRENQTVPADVIVVSAQNHENLVFEMSKLIGYSSLVQKFPLKFSRSLNLAAEVPSIEKVSGILRLAEPNTDYSSFFGEFKLDKTPGAIDIDVNNVLFKGGMLKGKSSVLAVIAYCGLETKLQLNTISLKRKLSKLERTVNRWVFGILLVLILAVFLSVMGYYFIGTGYHNKESLLETIITFTLLYNNIIPISLFMVIDIIRISQSFFTTLKSKEIVFNTETVNENLGQTEFLLTDKTGSLTDNKLSLTSCIIGDKRYEKYISLENLEEQVIDTKLNVMESTGRGRVTSISYNFDQLKLALDEELPGSMTNQFVKCMALSNELFKADEGFLGSLEEVALIEGCKALGIEFDLPETNVFELTREDTKAYYRKIANRPITKDKKGSRVLLEDNQGSGVLYIKGNPESVMPLLKLSKNSEETLKAQLKHLNEKNSRVLILGYKKISAEEILETKAKIQWIKKSLLNPESRIETMFKELEKGVKYLGVAGLNEELLPNTLNTINSLKDAGIKVWLTSSDSLHNTLLVARESEILEPSSKVYEVLNVQNEFNCCKMLMKGIKMMIFNETRSTAQPAVSETIVRRRSRIGEEISLINVSEEANERNQNDVPRLPDKQNSDISLEVDAIIQKKFDPNTLDFSLVIDRKSLHLALRDTDCRKMLVCLLVCAKSVCFVELMPEDKGSIVRLLQECVSYKPLVVCVGSGEGDINMLQQGDVGIGIERSKDSLVLGFSDIVVPSFTRLGQLILTQGHWNYSRLSRAILLYLYKNCFLTVVLLSYTFLCDFSGTSIFSAPLLVGFNLFFTSLPILVIGIFDEDMPSEKMASQPQVYTVGINEQLFNLKKLLIYFGIGCIQGVILVVLTFIGFPNILTTTGDTESLVFIGTITYITLVLSVLLQIFLDTYCYSLLYIISHVLSIISLIIFIIIITCTNFPSGELYGVGAFLSTSPLSLFTIFFTSLFCVIPNYVAFNYAELFFSQIINKVRASYSLAIYGFNKLENYKNSLESLYINTAHWKSKEHGEKFSTSKFLLKFKLQHIEKKFTENYIRGNLVLFKWTLSFLWLLIILWTIFGALVINQSTEYTLARIIISAAGSLMLFLLWTDHFIRNYQFYITLLIFITLIVKFILDLVFQETSILASALVPSVTFLVLNVDWLRINLLNLMNLILFIISISVEYSAKEQASSAALLSITFITIIIAIILTSAIVGYFLEISQRTQHKLNNKAHGSVEKIQSILGMMLPQFVRNRVKNHEYNIADDQGEVTILFCDICDFDGICKEYNYKDLTMFLDKLFSSFDDLCENFGVAKIETVGKTYMACAGLKDSDKDLPEVYRSQPHARRCIELAFAMIQEVNSIQLKNGSTLQVKIGINSGGVAAGVVGYHKPQFSLVGDTVNTASRMCSTLDTQNSIQISKVTHDYIRHYSDLEFEERTVYAKGKGDILVYKVTESKPDNSDIAGGFGNEQLSNKVNSTIAFNEVIVENSEQKTQKFSRNSRMWKEDILKRKDSHLIQKSPLLKVTCAESAPEKEFRMKRLENNYYSIMLALLIAISTIFLLTIFEICEWVEFEKYTKESIIISRSIVVIFLLFILLMHSRIYMKIYYPYLIIICLILMTVIVMIELSDNSIGIPPDMIGLEIMYIIIILSHSSAASLPLVIAVNIFIFVPWIALAVNTQDQSLHLTNALLVAGFSIINFKAIFTQEKSDRANYNLTWLADKEIKANESLLIQMMPAHVLENLEHGKSITDRLLQVTLIFADIVGFTDWSSTRKPEEIVQMLSNLFTRFDKLCVEFDVYKVHTIGDCYVVMGDVGKKKRDPSKECLNVIKMAYRMIETIKEENAKHNSRLDMRIGVHTGEVIAGVIGTNIVRYDIYGPDVLIANKMESNGTPGMIKCSEDTKKMLESRNEEAFEFEESKTLVVPVIGCVKKTYYIRFKDLNSLENLE